jgi:hypothetical protein
MVRKAASRALVRMLGETSLVAVLSTSGQTNTGFTHSQSRLEEALAGLKQVRGFSHALDECPDIDHYEAYLIIHLHDAHALKVVASGGEHCPGAPVTSLATHDESSSANDGIAKAAAEWEMPRGEQATRFTLEAFAKWHCRWEICRGNER